MFPVKELPRLPKGKGNKILDLPGEERLLAFGHRAAGTVFDTDRRQAGFQSSNRPIWTAMLASGSARQAVAARFSASGAGGGGGVNVPPPCSIPQQHGEQSGIQQRFTDVGLDQPPVMHHAQHADQVTSRCRRCQLRPSRLIMPLVDVAANGISSRKPAKPTVM